MKKALLLIAILVVILSSPLIAEEMKWTINVGTGIATSNVGVGLKMGQWRFQASAYTGFPNLVILTVADKSNNSDLALWDAIKGSFKFGGVNINASYDLLDSPEMDLNVGLSIAGSKFPDILSWLGIKNMWIIGAHATADMTIYFSEEAKDGLFFGAEVPVISYASANNEPASVVWLDALLPILVFSAKVGYTHTF